MNQKTKGIILSLIIFLLGLFFIFSYSVGIAAGGCGKFVSANFCDYISFLLPVFGAIIISVFEYIILNWAFNKKVAIWTIAIFLLTISLLIIYFVFRELQYERKINEKYQQERAAIFNAKTVEDCSNPIYKYQCILMLAVRTNNTEICDYLKESTTSAAACSLWVEQAKNGQLSTNSCNNFINIDGRYGVNKGTSENEKTQGLLKSYCYYTLGIYFKDKALCNKTSERTLISCDSYFIPGNGS